jgi:predicted DNA-binding protein
MDIDRAVNTIQNTAKTTGWIHLKEAIESIIKELERLRKYENDNNGIPQPQSNSS